MKVQIQNIEDVEIAGVSYCTKEDCKPYLETYFSWTAYPLVCKYNTNEMSCGLLTAWHHLPVFTQIETHEDYETFYFVCGEALMLFCDLDGNKPLMETAQIVRVKSGTEVIVAPGKGHFVPVGVTDCFQAVVVAPPQTAPRVNLPDEICGV